MQRRAEESEEEETVSEEEIEGEKRIDGGCVESRSLASRNVYAWYIIMDRIRVNGVIWACDVHSVMRNDGKAGVIGGD